MSQRKCLRIGNVRIMQIIWSDFAIDNLKAIFDYYKVKANKKLSHKIRQQILEATK